jgi:chromosomal replication initiator protein
VTVDIATIQYHVAASFGTPLIDMKSDRRSLVVARPRQIAIYLARHLTAHSFPALGRAFGGRDHSSIMHSVRRVESLRRADPDFAARIASLRQELETEPEMV